MIKLKTTTALVMALVASCGTAKASMNTQRRAAASSGNKSLALTKPQTLAPLRRILANTYTLYLSTQKCHWNIESPAFYGLHTMLEKQYESLAHMVDDLAERIRALGAYAPGTFQEFQEVGQLPPLKENTGNSIKLLSFLKTSYELLITQIEEVVTELKDTDPGTVHILTDQLYAHQKALWMIESSLK